MRKSLVMLVCLAILALIGSAAMAKTVSYEANFDPMQINDDGSAALAQFDPSLGTLKSVTFKLDVDWSGKLFMENLGLKKGGSTTGEAEWTMDVTAPVEFDGALSDGVLYKHTVAKYDGTKDFGGLSGWTEEWARSSEFEANGVDLTAFIGKGDVTIGISTYGSAYVIGTPDFDGGARSCLNAKATVCYDYAPVPEPSSLMGLAMGIVPALGFIIRRRRS